MQYISSSHWSKLEINIFIIFSLDFQLKLQNKGYLSNNNLLFNTKLSFSGTKLYLYLTIVRPTLTYGSEAWPMAVEIEQEFKALRIKY